ncbi:hypothetical protein SASPL_105126 [Salvia splendens]|uniref:Uncharacterized protein n=1 Tax=Salvia splendens TaxID=180675 RepID=A0A8X9A916_SALSN|nr:hypothetical protein SASPL_105126 [Salvia splendens]
MKQSGSKTSPSHHPPNFTRLVSQPEELPNYMSRPLALTQEENDPRFVQRGRLLEQALIIQVCTQQVARATCSSTLKGSKFPDYPGGAGLQGTSGLKVCPCSYCSLNGRLRALVPPLKCFPSAKQAIKHDKGTKDSRNEPYTGDTELNCIEDECSIVHENKATPETEDARSTRATVKSEKSNQESEGTTSSRSRKG